MKQVYVVGLGYTGECCSDPHAWVVRVRAETEDEAKRIGLATIKRANGERGGLGADIAESSVFAVPESDLPPVEAA